MHTKNHTSVLEVLIRAVSCFILLLISAPFFLHAQTNKINFRFLSAKDGFYPDKVRQIVQNTDRVLWLATNEGLITYDGIRFRPIQEEHQKNAPKGTDILCLLTETNGDVWVGSNKGLALYNKLSDTFTQIAFPGLPNVYVVSICKDSKGIVWVGTDAGIFKINSKTQAVPFLKTNPFNGTLPFVRIDKAGNIVVVTHNSIYQYHPQTAVCIDSIAYIQQKFLSDNYHTAVELDAANTVWIGKYNGEVYKYTLDTKNVIRFDMKGITKNTSAIINYFDVRDPSKVWLAVDESGLYYYDLPTQKFVAAITPQNAKLPTYKINTVFVDLEGSTWLAMSKNGLALTNSYLNTFGKIIPPAEKSQIVSAILKDQQGNVWVGTDGAGIYVYNTAGVLQKHFYYNPTQPSSLSNDAILCMYLDSKNRIWIGSFRGGLSLYQPSTQTFKHYQEGGSTGLLRNDIRSITEDVEGNLWLAVHGKGVSKFNTQTEKAINYPYLSSAWTTKVLVDHQGTVWASANNGMSRLHKNDTVFVDINTEKQLTELQDHDINCIFEDAQKRLWVGTVNGLYLMNTKTDQLTEAPRVQQLGLASVKSIQQDSRGVLYVSTNRGLYKYIPDIGECGRYGIEDGLPGEDFVINASLATDSILYFGTSKGLCWFNPKGIDIESIQVKPIITELVVNDLPYVDEAYTLSNGFIELDYQQNHLLFQIASPTYKWGDEKFDVEFILEGLDKTWQKLGKNKSVNYPAIPPGNYTFKSRLRISGTEIVGPEYSFQVSIHPPFWETWWFRILLLLIGIAAVYAYNKIKTLRIEKQNVLLEEKITERTHELTIQKELLEKQHRQLELANATKDKLFSVIAHDLRSPFTSISSLAQLLYRADGNESEADKKTMTGYILKASKNALNVVENLLDWARTQRGRIQFNPLEVDLNQSITHVIQGFEFQLIDKNIQLQFHASSALIGIVDKDMFETILRNLIANAIKFTPSEGSITVALQQTEKSFDIRIQDTGVGMQAETLKKISTASFHNSQSGTSGEKGTGLGLELVQEFLAYHEATWEIFSEQHKGTYVQLHFNSACFIQQNIATDNIFGMGVVEETYSIADTQAPVFENRFEAIKGKTILVVDDQEDIRKSVVYTLRDYFVILEAENGQRALEIARAEMPDLILSDVVMPDMDGLELSAQLKNSVQTSHIPIVLLTSQKEEASIISGLHTGVEDYLLKPFHPQILLLKIGNLLQNRESLKMKLSLDEAYLLKPISENSLDKVWLTKIHDLIEEHLSNEDFNVEQLSKEMNMHRSNFSKKLTALTGYTPTDLIRMQRMKRAAKLLLASGKNISEIAFEVGFSDPKYFSKSFKAHFGVSPSEYGKTPD